jgi:hypothetical protein
MSTDELLGYVKEFGLEVLVDPDGTPRLKGKRSEASEKLLRVLKLNRHREEIVRRLKPRLARRVVLLVGDRDSAVDRVLEECSPQGHHGRVRPWAQQFPGRTVAAEWLRGERWERFLWMTWPVEKRREEDAETVA